MPICPKCDTAYLDDESHDCVPRLSSAAASATLLLTVVAVSTPFFLEAGYLLAMERFIQHAIAQGWSGYTVLNMQLVTSPLPLVFGSISFWMLRRAHRNLQMAWAVVYVPAMAGAVFFASLMFGGIMTGQRP